MVDCLHVARVLRTAPSLGLAFPLASVCPPHRSSGEASAVSSRTRAGGACTHHPIGAIGTPSPRPHVTVTLLAWRGRTMGHHRGARPQGQAGRGAPERLASRWMMLVRAYARRAAPQW
jgi:hypothetical protein